MTDGGDAVSNWKFMHSRGALVRVIRKSCGSEYDMKNKGETSPFNKQRAQVFIATSRWLSLRIGWAAAPLSE